MKETGSCFKCLKKSHKVSECKRVKQCYYCKRDSHHSAICTQRQSNSVGYNAADHLNVVPNIEESNSEPSLVTPSKSLLLFSTALVKNDKASKGNHTSKEIPLKVILDVASGRSYITEKAAKTLNLKPHSYDILTYTSFGSEKVPVADIKMKAKDGAWIQLKVTIVPVITCPVNKYPINTAEFPILNSVQLAEPLSTSSEQVELDILIGLDYYFAIVLKDRIDLTHKLVLMHTRIGWVPTGAIDMEKAASTATSLICPSKVETVLLTPDSDSLMQSVVGKLRIQGQSPPYVTPEVT